MIIIMGGGLAGSLMAYRLTQLKSKPKFLVIEEESRLGGNHTWSFHESDLAHCSLQWIKPLVQTSWNRQEVRFPDYTRKFEKAYYSVTSSKLDEVVRPAIQEHLLHEKVLDHGSTHVRLKDRTINATVVFDARGLEQSSLKFCGYQKFLGMEVELQKPHGLEHPVIMDVRCDQSDGYRFFYLLPWTSRSVLIEDTRYSLSPELNTEEMKAEIRTYCRKSNWVIQTEGRAEVGCLPIPLEPFSKLKRSDQSLPIGTRGGYFHWTTGYSFPYAVQVAEALENVCLTQTAPSIADFEVALAPIQKEILSQSKYLTMLNKMLFLAAEPSQRWKIFHRFYGLKEGLIFRFYAGQLRMLDQARILAGRPPVRVSQAIKSLLAKPSGSMRDIQQGTHHV